MLASLRNIYDPIRTTRLLSRGGLLLAVLIGLVTAVSSCSGPSTEPDTESLEEGWLASEAAVCRAVEKQIWNPGDLAESSVRGRHPRIRTQGGRDVVRSQLSATRFSVDIVVSKGRSLVLDGFPAPSVDGEPQEVTVEWDGKPIGTARWSGPARHTFPVPAELSCPGRHGVVLRYRYTSDDPAGGRGAKKRGMAWHSIELLGSRSAPETDLAQLSRQDSPAVWWRYVAASSAVTFNARGNALTDSTIAALWIDRGDGLWQMLRRVEVGSSAAVDLSHTITREPGAVVRLGVAVLAGTVAWETMSNVRDEIAERRPVVLVTFDTTRRDGIGSYGSTTRTPHFDRLAAKGVRWLHAYSPTPSTGPAHATIFLSQHPGQHGVTGNGISLPQVTNDNLAVQAKAHGYQTAAFVSLGTVAGDLGFARGFDVFDDDFDHGWWRFAAQVNGRALPWVAAHPQSQGEDPAFLWMHYSDPHRPYGTADEPGQGVVLEINGTVVDTTNTLGLDASWPVTVRPGRNRLVLRSVHEYDDNREHWFILRDFQVEGGAARVSLAEGWQTVRKKPRMRESGALWIDSPADQPLQVTLRLRVEDNPTEAEARRRYATEVTAMDLALGELLEQLDESGWLQRGIVMVVADHGEDLGERGHFGHIHHVGSTLTHVPMIVWGKGIDPDVSENLVGLMDVAPTLWSLAGFPLPAEWQGVNALQPPSRRRLFLETYPPEADRHVRAVIELPYRVSGDMNGRGASPDIHDVLLDPPREVQFEDMPPSEAYRIRKLIEAWHEWPIVDSGPISVPAEMKARLRSLGYVQ